MGLSVVYVEFDWDTDIYRDRQVVGEKLQLARANLPREAVPMMAPISSIMGQVQNVGFTSRTGETSALELRRLIDRDVKPRILSLSGVAQVVTIGGQPTELQVVVDADRLAALDVTLDEVADATRRANVNVSGGTLRIGAKGPTVGVSGMLEDPEQLAKAVVRTDQHRSILISDVADVVFGPQRCASVTRGSTVDRA
jgi:Cu/Ag efflux pump CusA